MLSSYFKIAYRSLWKNKLYTVINIFGLALGIACCLLILLFVRDEWSFDTFHDRSADIYRVAVEENYEDDQQFLNTLSPIALGPALQDNFPEIESLVRIATLTDLLEKDELSFSERVHLVDDGFFDTFDFPMLAGTRFSDPSSIVISQEMAEKYFGEQNPLGQTIALRVGNDMSNFEISGVAENPPSNSSIQFGFLISFENGKQRWPERVHKSYFSVVPETYIQLPAGYDIAQLEEKTPALIKQIMGERYKEGAYILHYQAMPDIHLDTNFPAGHEAISDPVYSYILAVIAFFVFLIACINFTTLAIGRSAERAREVGVRKVVGANRSQLIRQFWGEAVLLSLLALLLGVVLAQIFLPTFNVLSGKELVFAFDRFVLGGMVALMLLIGLVAGSYPAIVLSGFNPVEVLKGRMLAGKLKNRSGLRQTLTVVQFALSIMLIICTLGMAKQLSYLQEKNLGYEREHVVVVPTGLSVQEGLPVGEKLRNELAGQPSIIDMTTSVFALSEGWAWLGYEADDGTYREFRANMIDPEFIDAMNIEMVAGRNFSRENSADREASIIVNEALVAEYGWQDPIGKTLPGSFTQSIIGVVKDFNYESLHSPVSPLVLTMDLRSMARMSNDVSFSASPNPKMAVRIRGENIQSTIALLKRTWETVAPSISFDYYFLDDALGRQYQQEERLSNIVTYATGFALLIACLGLFGLAALVATKRTKEIGVRKVLGASVANIVVMLSRDFLKLVLISMFIAMPVAYWAINGWLDDFAYRTNIDAGIFVLAAVLAILISLLTIGYHTMRSALGNPIKSLRYE